MYTSYLNDGELLIFRENILRDLRVELGQLKNCQSQSVLIGITGAGIILGVLKGSDAFFYRSLLLLLPLLILLPFWMIFYDKARTISRIVGFLRVQERLTLDNSPFGAIGWEMAMSKYWGKKCVWDTPEINENISRINHQQTNSRKDMRTSVYWFTVYTIFTVMSIMCLGLSFSSVFFPQPFAFLDNGIILSPNNEAIIKATIPLFIISVLTYRRKYKSVKSKEFKKAYYSFWKIAITFWLVNIDISALIWIFFPYAFNELIYMLFFWAFAMLFLTIAFTNWWIFANLVGGRYSYGAFEYRWKIIMELPT